MPLSRRSFTQLLIAGAALAAPAPKNRRSQAQKHIDAAWFRKTLAEETKHWLAAAATPSGFFQTTLDREWRPTPKQVATLNSQNRQLFVMAAGFRLTRDQAYLDALTRGADFLLARFRDPQYGGMFFSVGPDGAVVDERKDSYGHAFAIFGLSHAASVTGSAKYRDAALETWATVTRSLRDEHGFFKTTTARDFSQARGTNWQNAMMHLFEALLALHDATGSKDIYRAAEAHADAIYTRLYQPRGGYLPEMYTPDWRPLPVAQGGKIDIGHQFEWAFLLSHAVEKGFPRKYLRIGEGLLNYGMRFGYDTGTGGIFSPADYEGNAVKGAKSWWEQCELLRALMHYAALRDRPDLWQWVDESLAFVKRDFIDPEYGGWYGSFHPSKPREGRALNKGSLWQVGYHVCGMYEEALRLAG